MNNFVGNILQNKFYAYCYTCYQVHADLHLYLRCCYAS